MDKDFWKEELGALTKDELKEVSKLIEDIKESWDTKEELIDVLRRWKEKYPQSKYFYCGGICKGAYECSGELWSYDWNEYEICLDNIYEGKDISYNEGNFKEIVKKFESYEDFCKVILNSQIPSFTEFKQFRKELSSAKNVPRYDKSEASDFSCGEEWHQFIDIETGETYEMTVYE